MRLQYCRGPRLWGPSHARAARVVQCPFCLVRKLARPPRISDRRALVRAITRGEPDRPRTPLPPRLLGGLQLAGAQGGAAAAFAFATATLAPSVGVDVRCPQAQLALGCPLGSGFRCPHSAPGRGPPRSTQTGASRPLWVSRTSTNAAKPVPGHQSTVIGDFRGAVWLDCFRRAESPRRAETAGVGPHALLEAAWR